MKFFFFLALCSTCFAKYCTFIPPENWEIAQTKNPTPHVKMGFLGKGGTEFRPSINLALEEGVDVSLKEYVKAVKELQTADPTTQWRDLGTFPLSCGNGKLIELTTRGPWGDVKILQLLFVQEETAYILTAAVLKKEFAQFQQAILKAFRSLRLTDTLFTLIEDEKRRTQFIHLFNSLGTLEDKHLEWENLQKKVAEHKDLGPYWAYLLLQEGYANIHSCK